MYQHGVLPKLLCPLLVHEVPMMTVEALERTISQFLRRWLWLPRSLCSTKLQLKVIRAREVMMYRDSSDIKVASAGMLVKTRRKWKA